jgi:hypothetical protein
MAGGDQATGHGHSGRRRRRKAAVGRRAREVKVTFTDEELQRIRGNAAAAGWGLKAWIAVAALTPPNAGGAGGVAAGGVAGGERAMQLVEFMRAGRQLRGIAVNVNQVARAINGVLAGHGGTGDDRVAELLAAAEGVPRLLHAVAGTQARVRDAVIALRTTRPRA